MEIIKKIQKAMPTLIQLILGYGLLLVIGIIDVITGYQVGFFVFYYIPIVLVILNSKGNNVLFISLICTLVWGISEYLSKEGTIILRFFVWNTGMRFLAFMFVAFIIHRLKIMLEREQKLARKDSLTGVWNRYSFEEFGTREVAKSKRFNRPLTVAYLDCDNFKELNDFAGHAEGDRCLHSIAEVIEHNIRSVDLVARLGGDEFIILLTETGSAEARVVMERVMTHLRDAMDKDKWGVTFSIGVVTYFAGIVQNIDRIIMEADQVMYETKKGGKNTITYTNINA